MNKYEIQENTVGQYTIRTIEDSPFVLFKDNLNEHEQMIPKRLVIEMFNLIGTSNTDWKETYRSKED